MGLVKVFLFARRTPSNLQKPADWYFERLYSFFNYNLRKLKSIYAFGDNNPVFSGGSETERMILRLQSDRRGILADILIKHDCMKCAEELYRKIEK